MTKIVGIGNALVDVLVRLNNDAALDQLGLLKGGMRLIGDQEQQKLTEAMQHMETVLATGGSAGNSMMALARLGRQPAYVGCVAADDMGNFFRRTCKAAGLEARMLTKVGQTGVANTFVSPDGERTFATHLGVAGMMSADDITEALFEGCDLLHIEGYLVQNHLLMDAICETAKRMGLQMSIDLASYNVVKDDLAYMRHLVKDYMDIVFANEEEAEAFCGTTNPKEALADIASLCKVPVVKLGARGAMVMCDGKPVVVPARKVQVVDTTAAGDFFAAGFLHAYTLGAELERCLEVGTLLSSHVVQVVGSGLSEAVWSDINAELKDL